MVSDLVGQRFGKLVVTRLSKQCTKKGKPLWECKCDCGNEVLVSTGILNSGKKKSCGCLQRKFPSKLGKSNYKDITGKRFGRLVALRVTDKRYRSGSVIWECICDCGKKVEMPSEVLLSKGGFQKSCGCLVHEMNVERGKSFDLAKHFGQIENTSVSLIKSKKARKDSGTGHRGVSFNKRCHKYYSYIGFQKKIHHLGYFNTLEEAIAARKKAEEEIFEPFLKSYEENLKKSKEIDSQNDKQ